VLKKDIYVKMDIYIMGTKPNQRSKTEYFCECMYLVSLV